jgi:hypothetical protein
MNIEEKLSSLRRADAGTDQNIAAQYPANWNMDEVFRKAYRKYQIQMNGGEAAIPEEADKQEKPHVIHMPMHRFVTAACLLLAVGIAGTIGIKKLAMREPDAIPPEETVTTVVTETTKSTIRVHGPAITGTETDVSVPSVTTKGTNTASTQSKPAVTNTDTAALTVSSPSDTQAADSVTAVTLSQTAAETQTSVLSDGTVVSGISYTTATTMTTTHLITSTSTTMSTTATQRTVTSTSKTTAATVAKTTRATTATKSIVTQSAPATSAMHEEGGQTGGGVGRDDAPEGPERPSGNEPSTDQPTNSENALYVYDDGGSFKAEFSYPYSGKNNAPSMPSIHSDHYHIYEDSGMFRIDDDWSHHSGYLRLYSGKSGSETLTFSKNEYSRWEETSVNGKMAYLIYGSQKSWLLWSDGEHLCTLYTEQGFEYNLTWMAEALDTH